jgi:5-bromo-4-chloroindolyl phosphate hydrolysis protein
MFGQRQDIELGLLTAFILDMVSEVDYSVGPFVGESYLMWVEKNGNKKSIALRGLTDKALREYKEKIKVRRELLQKVWRLCDTVGEEKILERLGALEKGV